MKYHKCKNAWNSIYLYVAVRNALFMEVLDVANHLPERHTYCEQVRSLLKCDDSEVAAYPSIVMEVLNGAD